MLRRFAANAAHGNALDLSPLSEVRKLRCDKVSGARRSCRAAGYSGQSRFGMSFYVVFADASARACALYFIDVYADFASQAAGVRRGWNWLAMLGSSHLAQLHRHGKRFRARLRLIGRQRLFFGFTFSANGSLECKPRTMLSGDVFDRTARRAGWFGG